MDQRKSGVLLALTTANFFITYVTGVMLARRLGVDNFDEWAVAVALVTMLSTLAELGLGKYGMRILPVYGERKEWGAMRGYRRFAWMAILAVSTLLALGFGLPELMSNGFRSVSPSVMALLFLPALALVGYGAEVVQANGATVRAALLSRIVVPGATMLLVGGFALSGKEMSATQGVILFGLGWVAGLLLLRVFLRMTTPREMTSEPAVVTRWDWLNEARPFLLFALLVVALAKVGIVIFKQVAVDDDEVSVFAAAMETGAFLSIIAKSTDKMFLPQISVALERRDGAFLLIERRRRLLWMGAVCAAFVAAALLFGRQILGLYGEAFKAGYWPLVIVASATAVWTLFSLAPSYLTYVGRKRFVVIGTAIAVLLVMGLTYVLGARYGALGAALGYGIPVAALYLTFSLAGMRDIRAWMRSNREAERSLEEHEDREHPF